MKNKKNKAPRLKKSDIAHIKIMDVPIYNTSFYFVTNREDRQLIARWLGVGEDVLNSYGGCSGEVICSSIGKLPNVAVMVLDGRMETLVHELGHLSMMILESRGIDPTVSDGEPFCYLQDYLFKQCMKYLGQSTKLHIDNQKSK